MTQHQLLFSPRQEKSGNFPLFATSQIKMHNVILSSLLSAETQNGKRWLGDTEKLLQRQHRIILFKKMTDTAVSTVSHVLKRICLVPPAVVGFCFCDARFARVVLTPVTFERSSFVPMCGSVSVYVGFWLREDNTLSCSCVRDHSRSESYLFHGHSLSKWHFIKDCSMYWRSPVQNLKKHSQ